MDIESLAGFLLLYVIFLLSVTCHEAAHALAAKLGGDLTAYQAGQVTLNPMPHIQREPWGMVVMPILSMVMGGMLLGWGSAPYDPYWEQRYPRRAAWMALAGPAANVVLAILAAIAINVLSSAGVFSPHSIREGTVAFGWAVFAEQLFQMNIILAFFNLLPVPPLDGNAAITLLMPESLAARFREVTRSGFLAMFGIWIAWFLAAPFLVPVLNFATRLLIRH